MPGSRVLDAARRLRASLDLVAGALSSPDLATLVAAESGLAAALYDLGSIRRIDAADRAAVASELAAARAALARCRVLGAAAADAATLSLAAQGKAAGYTRAGATAPGATVRGSGLKARL
ncbi:MAG: hypothetical protein AB7P34_06475 [Vicinamibacterales bacterium]